MQACPGAAWVGLGAEQGQTKRGVVELQTDAVGRCPVDAYKSRNPRAAHQQGVGGHGGVVGQGDGLGRRLKGHAAAECDEVIHRQLHMARGAGQVAQAAVGVERDGGTRPSEHIERAKAVVDYHIGRATDTGHATVDLDRQVAGLGIKARQADQGHRLGLGFEAGELACGGIAHRHFADQGQAKVHALHGQANRMGGATLDARKSVDPVAADGEQIGFDLGGRLGLGGVV